MYDYNYIIKDYSSDMEYQQEFLKTLGIEDITDVKLNSILDEVYNKIKMNDDWIKLLSNLLNLFSIIDISNLELGLPIGLTYTYFKKTHLCLQEFVNNDSVTLVQEFNKSFNVSFNE